MDRPNACGASRDRACAGPSLRRGQRGRTGSWDWDGNQSASVGINDAHLQTSDRPHHATGKAFGRRHVCPRQLEAQQCGSSSKRAHHLGLTSPRRHRSFRDRSNDEDAHDRERVDLTGGIVLHIVGLSAVTRMRSLCTSGRGVPRFLWTPCRRGNEPLQTARDCPRWSKHLRAGVLVGASPNEFK